MRGHRHVYNQSAADLLHHHHHHHRHVYNQSAALRRASRTKFLSSSPSLSTAAASCSSSRAHSSPSITNQCRSFSFSSVFRSVPRWSNGVDWKSPATLTLSEGSPPWNSPALNDPRIAIRNCDNFQVTKEDVEKIIDWENTSPKQVEIPFKLARDFTGVPALVDLACMRDAMNKLGSDSNKINPLVPVDLVIDQNQKMQHRQIWSLNSKGTRRDLLFSNGGQMHSKTCLLFLQVLINLEYLGCFVFNTDGMLYPDSVVGTDSHTTMIDGLGVAGWGVGGIEAEAAMLGQLSGKLRDVVTATDFVLTVTQMLRKHGVVGKFVEFYGEGVGKISLADRATIANMSPEYGATMGFFPVDHVALQYLKLTGRSEETGFAIPKEVQNKVVKFSFHGQPAELNHGSVVIAAITSCTNTSNPSVMLGAGLVAKKVCELGLQVKSWIKTSLAPGYGVVTKYLLQSGLQKYLNEHGFHIVGCGCTTCIGNSGDLDESVASAISENDIVAAAVLSGNRNFKGRVHPLTRANYLASPPLVVAYALAGTVDVDFEKEPIGVGKDGKNVYFKDIWPSTEEVAEVVQSSVLPNMLKSTYESITKGNPMWNDLSVPASKLYSWDPNSTYIHEPPYFKNKTMDPPGPGGVKDAHCLLNFGDSITTDHISPAGSINKDSPAAKYLLEHGVERKDFNSYGSRRGNDEVMARGTFTNIRIVNTLLNGEVGPKTLHVPTGEKRYVFDAAARYKAAGQDTIVLAGAEYGSGSSRDWAAKGPMLLGVKAMIAKSFERIHRSNLVGWVLFRFVSSLVKMQTHLA
ncbi:hypothetical protein HYC85_011342 [Camellia sinensis]|uniref:aconitate hydratase n=1 Tax=Camellia sinensis TaxID=4442 RepID=A0A7J7H926_CAMSI|nr:hypothetical protein HYC85_011342 [Camellia sinensis]